MASSDAGLIAGAVIGGTCLAFMLLYIYKCLTAYFNRLSNKDSRMKWQLEHRHSIKGNFIMTYSTPIEDTYNVDSSSILGKGSFGVVVVGTHKETNVEYAIKIVNKSTGKTQRLERELKLLKDVDHPNIVRLFTSYDTPEQVGFVMEICTGGHLGAYIERFNRGNGLTEMKAKYFMGQLISAVAHMHDRGICHRDIKLQNILLEHKRQNAQIKLIDFGFGTRFIGALPLKTKCGTLYTTAPEVFNRNYDERCDVWSCGVVAYICLCGQKPFNAKVTGYNIGFADKAAKDLIIKNISAGKYTFEHPAFRNVSSHAIQFIQTLLHVDFKTRIKSNKALELPWLTTDTSPILSSSLDRSEFETEALQRVVANVRRHSLLTTLHQTSMVAVAFSLPQCKLEESRAIFQSFDSDRNGSLDRDEFRRAMAECSALANQHNQQVNNELSPSTSLDEYDKLFDAIDANGDGQISFTEFLAATLDPRDFTAEALRAAFNLMDVDNKGYITTEDMLRVLNVTGKRKRSFPQNRLALSPMDVKVSTNPENGSAEEAVVPHRRASMSAVVNTVGRRPSILATPRRSSISFLSQNKNILPVKIPASQNSNSNSSENEFTENSGNQKGKQPPQTSNNVKGKSPFAAKSSPALLLPQDKQTVANKDGELDPILKERVRRMMERCDVNGDGVISYAAFLWAMADGDAMISSKPSGKNTVTSPVEGMGMKKAYSSSRIIFEASNDSTSMACDQNVKDANITPVARPRRKSCLDTQGKQLLTPISNDEFMKNLLNLGALAKSEKLKKEEENANDGESSDDESKNSSNDNKEDQDESGYLYNDCLPQSALPPPSGATNTSPRNSRRYSGTDATVSLSRRSSFSKDSNDAFDTQAPPSNTDSPLSKEAQTVSTKTAIATPPSKKELDQSKNNDSSKSKAVQIFPFLKSKSAVLPQDNSGHSSSFETAQGSINHKWDISESSVYDVDEDEKDMEEEEKFSRHSKEEVKFNGKIKGSRKGSGNSNGSRWGFKPSTVLPAINVSEKDDIETPPGSVKVTKESHDIDLEKGLPQQN